MFFSSTHRLPRTSDLIFLTLVRYQIFYITLHYNWHVRDAHDTIRTSTNVRRRWTCDAVREPGWQTETLWWRDRTIWRSSRHAEQGLRLTSRCRSAMIVDVEGWRRTTTAGRRVTAALTSCRSCFYVLYAKLASHGTSWTAWAGALPSTVSAGTGTHCFQLHCSLSASSIIFSSHKIHFIENTITSTGVGDGGRGHTSCKTRAFC